MLNNLEDLILTKFRVASHHMSMPRSICDSLVNYTHTQLYFTTNVVAKKTYIIKHKLNKLNKLSLN